MNQERDTFGDEGVDLREIFRVLLRKWWVVMAVLIVSVAAAWVSSGRMPDVYEARTQLLLVSRTSAGLTASGAILPDVSSALSVDTLSNLALANDLLENIVQTLNRDNPGSGSPASVEALARMMKVDIKTSAQNKTGVLPLLTLTVRGGDPILLKRIAETWADLFIQLIQRNVSLFASESARSFDYIQGQYEETRQALLTKTQEKLEYQRQNPLDTMRSTLEGQMDLFKQFFSELGRNRVILVTTQAEREELAQALESEPRILDESKVFINGAVVEKAINPLYIFIKEKLTDAATREASLAANVAQLEKRVEEYRASIANLSAGVEEITVTESTFNSDLAVLTSNLETLAAKLQEARLAKEEQGGTIRVVESPIVPQVPTTSPDRQLRVYLGAALGLILGVVVALLLHYLLEPPVPSPGPQRRGPATPAS